MKAIRNFRNDSDQYAISTINANDRDSKQFETAIASKEEGGWKVVELYETFEESKIGHTKWLDMTKSNLFNLNDHEEVFADNDVVDPLDWDVVDNINKL